MRADPAPRSTSPPPQASAGGAEPQWQWFCVSNVIAVGVFSVSMMHLMQHWIEHGRSRGASFAVGQPAVAAALAGAVGSLLYFFAFCGVAFIAADVDESAPGSGAPLAMGRDLDADVVIVGAGTVGASMATVLARQGKKVTVIERCVARGPGWRVGCVKSHPACGW